MLVATFAVNARQSADFFLLFFILNQVFALVVNAYPHEFAKTITNCKHAKKLGGDLKIHGVHQHLLCVVIYWPHKEAFWGSLSESDKDDLRVWVDFSLEALRQMDASTLPGKDTQFGRIEGKVDVVGGKIDGVDEKIDSLASDVRDFLAASPPRSNKGKSARTPKKKK